MIEPQHEIPRASRLLSEISLLQLLLCFLLSLGRVDAFIVGAVIGLYATREQDRQAVELYMLLLAAGAAMDALYLLTCEEVPPLLFLGVLAGLALKAIAAVPCVTLRGGLPRRRLATLTADDLSAHVKAAMAEALSKHAARSVRRDPPPPAAARTALPPESGAVPVAGGGGGVGGGGGGGGRG
eukprot:CAMPEP_0185491286 /NCGR_PEP_ID=MMETSP1366-20130426/14585_1 /TAXON_ID=38817 /ORGANISM="Gephyrocapsa oceanica, Strain RCC1303" /LENGTH=182 /DNA_ID=CAMNT_0028100037 /DNA_START=23 /DNA_END=567 /DNA_ORIENTATION=-